MPSPGRVKRRMLLKLIRRLHCKVKDNQYGCGYSCAECGAPHPCETYRLADGFTRW